MSITTNTITEITGYTATSGGVISGVDDTFFPLTHRLMMNKFQLYKASNMKLNASVKKEFNLRPFQLYEDSKQSNKKFVLTGFSYRPYSDMYTDVQLNEYDNTTDMTLNIL
jgi:hypothetical protein